jgi:hypothetical protein
MSQDERASALFIHAAKCYQQGHYARAVSYYLAGLKIHPSSPEIHADLAKAYEMLGFWDEALKALDCALRLRPDFPTATRRRRRIAEEKQVYQALTAGLELRFNPTEIQSALKRHFSDTVQYKERKIERDFYTLTFSDTLPGALIEVVCHLIEHTRNEVGEIFQSYPRHSVSISLEIAKGYSVSQMETVDARLQAGVASEDSTTSMPLWATACYYDGAIRLIYRPYADAGLGVLYSVVRHEWTHLLVDSIARRRCPGWFDEGLALFIARPMLNAEKELLQQAEQNGQLLAPDELRRQFSRLSTKQCRLAYLQSRAVVEQLIQHFGLSAIRVLLAQVGAGVAFEKAFRERFGKTVEETVASWRVAIRG